MVFRICKICSPLVVLGAGLWLVAYVPGQDAAPGQAAAGPDMPQVPQGVEVMARGPVHEAFATPTAEPVPTNPVSKQPPQPIDEMPPAEKPEGNVVWIGGYWAWDDDRHDFLWVSGTWRVPPPGKHWVAGYWREDGDKWQWVPGFWAETQQGAEKHDLTYLPQPPEPPQTAPPGQAPNADSFYVPGQWVWRGDGYAWQAGYWARVQSGYVWVPAHFRWTPYGYVYIAGYWDLALASRGVMYAPVVIEPEVVTVGFVYTPVYVVPHTVVVDAFFVRPCCCHYYYGDYYGPTYVGCGYTSVFVYSQRHYDSVIVYERWEHRADPRWEVVQVNVYRDRYAGRAPCPPRCHLRPGRHRPRGGDGRLRLHAVLHGAVHGRRRCVLRAAVLLPLLFRRLLRPGLP